LAILFLDEWLRKMSYWLFLRNHFSILEPNLMLSLIFHNDHSFNFVFYYFSIDWMSLLLLFILFFKENDFLLHLLFSYIYLVSNHIWQVQFFWLNKHASNKVLNIHLIEILLIFLLFFIGLKIPLIIEYFNKIHYFIKSIVSNRI
jgi:hypothetical protein